MKIVFIGAVELGLACLRVALASPYPVVGAVTKRSSTFNADFAPVGEVCEAAGIPVRYTTDAGEPETLAWLRGLAPDLILAIGWSHLLPAEVLRLPPKGVVGYHPSLLPRHRGRHPLIWAMALGLEETGSSFFLMDEGVDDGDILSQQRVPILPEDDAAGLYARVQDEACGQLGELLPRLAAGTTVAVPQDGTRASSWRKRSKLDGRIDWRMSPQAIRDLVRALSRPYPGASALTATGEEAVVWRCRVHAGPVPADAEPGKILAVHGHEITVKTWGGAIVLEEHELPLPQEGDYL